MLNALDQWTQPGFGGPALHWSRATMRPPYTPPGPSNLPTQSSAGKIVAAEPHPWSRAIPMARTFFLQVQASGGSFATFPPGYGQAMLVGSIVRVFVNGLPLFPGGGRIGPVFLDSPTGFATLTADTFPSNARGEAWFDFTLPPMPGNYRVDVKTRIAGPFPFEQLFSQEFLARTTAPDGGLIPGVHIPIGSTPPPLFIPVVDPTEDKDWWDEAKPLVYLGLGLLAIGSVAKLLRG